MSPREVVTQWRKEADVLRQRGCGEQADMLVRLADEVETALIEQDGESVSMAEAVELSGFSESQLRRLKSEGSLENVGKGREVRFRRGDLPKKPAGKRVDLSRAVRLAMR